MKKYITIIAAGLLLAMTTSATSIEVLFDSAPERGSTGYWDHFVSSEADTVTSDFIATDPDSLSTEEADFIRHRFKGLTASGNFADAYALWDSGVPQLDPNINWWLQEYIRLMELTDGDLDSYVSNNVGKGLYAPAWQKAFKGYRATLLKSQQIAVTQTEKDGLIATPNRSAAQDKWLTEVSADLMALSLDQ